MNLQIRTLVTAVAVVCLCLSTSSAQTIQGRIRGRVADGSGGVLPGVAVVATSADARVVATTATDGAGEYVFAKLPAGTLTFPVHAYSHDENRCSITGGFVYRGSAVPAAAGRYFFGDYCTGELWSLRMVNGAATEVRREPITIRGLSTFGEDARGELYAGSVDTGRMYKLTP